MADSDRNVCAVLEALESRLLLSSTASISGTIWQDVKNNGVITAAAGWTIYLDLNQNSQRDIGEPFSTSSQMGQYSFTNLAAGTYSVMETIPANWQQLSPGPSNGNRQLVTVADGQAVIRKDFTNATIPTGSISGAVWNDANKNGIWDTTEKALSGWTVFLDSSANNLVNFGKATAVTDANGKYTFSSLYPNTYNVAVVLPGTTWTLTKPSTGFDLAVPLTAGQNVTGVNLGASGAMVAAAKITGNVFNDANSNKVHDGSENGLAGWLVYFDQDTDWHYSQGENFVTTDAMGNYTFSTNYGYPLQPGTYYVTVMPESGWIHTVPEQQYDYRYAVTVTAGGQVITSKNFGFNQPNAFAGQISGTVWSDSDRDSIRDAAERVLPSWVVYIDSNANGVLDNDDVQTVADANGHYVLKGLAAGTYSVREQLQTGWEQVAPTSAYSVTLTTNQVVDGEDFGNRLLNGPPTLTRINPLSGANLNTNFNIGYETLRAVSDASDPDPISFVVQSVPSGTLTKNGVAVVPGQTTLSKGESLKWLPPTGFTGQIDALSLSASDGFSVSAAPVTVKVNVEVYSIVGSDVTIWGTPGNDRFTFLPSGDAWVVILNGNARSYPKTKIDNITFIGEGGNDTDDITTPPGVANSLTFHPTTAAIRGNGLALDISGVAYQTAHGQPKDVAYLYDDGADDTVYVRPTSTYLFSAHFSTMVEGLSWIYTTASSTGSHHANFYDSTGDDHFTGYPTYSIMAYASGYQSKVSGFTVVNAFATPGGKDVANLYDSPGNDTFNATTTYATLQGPGYSLRTNGFETNNAYAGPSGAGGTDIASLYDSPVDDLFVTTPDGGYMMGDGLYNQGRGFAQIYGYAGAGADTAYFYGSAGNDSFGSWVGNAKLSGPNYYNRGIGFETIYASANEGNPGEIGGYDVAYITDSPGNDTYVFTPTYAKFTTPTQSIRAVAYAKVYMTGGTGGTDAAYLYDSAGSDTLTAGPASVIYSGTGFYTNIVKFASLTANGGTGTAKDTANLTDSSGADTLVATPTSILFTGPGLNMSLSKYATVNITGGTGGVVDTAKFYGGAGDDTFVGRPTSAQMSSTTYSTTANKFAKVYAYVATFATPGGTDKAYLYDSPSGTDLFFGTLGYGELTGSNYYFYIMDFPVINLDGTAGGINHILTSSLNYSLVKTGTWT